MNWIGTVVDELILGLLGKRWRAAIGVNLGVAAGILVAFHCGVGWGLATLGLCSGLGIIWERSVNRV